jgi:bifunctional non-homologous end joining protein LigD
MLQGSANWSVESVVSMVRVSVYPTGRSNDWLKKTCAARDPDRRGFALDGIKFDAFLFTKDASTALEGAGKLPRGSSRSFAVVLRACGEGGSKS